MTFSFIHYSIKKCKGYRGLYYKPMMIVNDDSRVINKLEASLTDNARVFIYDHQMFIVQATLLPPFATVCHRLSPFVTVCHRLSPFVTVCHLVGCD